MAGSICSQQIRWLPGVPRQPPRAQETGQQQLPLHDRERPGGAQEGRPGVRPEGPHQQGGPARGQTERRRHQNCWHGPGWRHRRTEIDQ